jgi:hypothetical protein
MEFAIPFLIRLSAQRVSFLVPNCIGFIQAGSARQAVMHPPESIASMVGESIANEVRSLNLAISKAAFSVLWCNACNKG